MMAMFGSSRRSALGGSLVETPEQRAERERLEAMFPGASAPEAVDRLGGMFGTSAQKLKPATSILPVDPDTLGQSGARPVPQEPNTAPGAVTPPTQDLDRKNLFKAVGNAPERPRDNTLRTIMGAALAAISDAATNNGRRGGPAGNAVEMWAKSRAAPMDKYRKDMADYQQRNRVASLPGMNQRELMAFDTGPKAWGSNMARAATSRYDAATLNPGDVRTFGQDGGSFQAPTRGQQYAGNLNLEPGTPQYSDAIRDQELGANGPTAFGNQRSLTQLRSADALRMERARQQGRMDMEGVRQGNRVETRGQPTYRDLNPPAPRAGGGGRGASRERTATDKNGNTVFYRGGRWVDAQGAPVQ
jgi:hypothetical protein